MYHAFSRHAHPQSPIEHQICLFHVANLIINQVQTFWVAFLWPEMACNGNEQPVAVHNGATTGLLDYYRSPSAGYHWDAEFFGGTVLVQHRTDSPRAEFDAGGRFGRNLSIGYPYLNRADGTEQMVQMDSITRCLNHSKHTSPPESSYTWETLLPRYRRQTTIMLTYRNRLFGGLEWRIAHVRRQGCRVRLPLPRLSR